MIGPTAPLIIDRNYAPAAAPTTRVSAALLKSMTSRRRLGTVPQLGAGEPLSIALAGLDRIAADAAARRTQPDRPSYLGTSRSTIESIWLVDSRELSGHVPWRLVKTAASAPQARLRVRHAPDFARRNHKSVAVARPSLARLRKMTTVWRAILKPSGVVDG
jgi:hypothetical protein